MIIDNRVWYALSDKGRAEYLKMYGKVNVRFGNYLQEIKPVLHPKAGRSFLARKLKFWQTV